MFFLPYSPRWLTKQNRGEEAKATLIRLHGGPKKAKMDIVDAEFMEMQLQIDWGESSRNTERGLELTIKRGRT